MFKLYSWGKLLNRWIWMTMTTPCCHLVRMSALFSKTINHFLVILKRMFQNYTHQYRWYLHCIFVSRHFPRYSLLLHVVVLHIDDFWIGLHLHMTRCRWTRLTILTKIRQLKKETMKSNKYSEYRTIIIYKK